MSWMISGRESIRPLLTGIYMEEMVVFFLEFKDAYSYLCFSAERFSYMSSVPTTGSLAILLSCVPVHADQLWINPDDSGSFHRSMSLVFVCLA